ncbi:C2H2-type zinc finger protein [Dehalobacter restrictus]|uniref:C2H2-type domain-containing protein n=1 Tax=Dehalobacter restrictus TaxID=55583 RepID=A0A857DDW0_9FIRM|nr:C2H2-type zinc finger protein [Dehalobacter restrictus]QGZ99429.1 hypothetical protein GQ588_01485 [Dehalobacter restrictus]
MIKFFGEPLKEINSKMSGKIMFRFDSKGEFITDDEQIIERAIGFFDHQELKTEEIGERIEKTYFIPAITITTKDDIEIEKNNDPQGKFFCKKCEISFDDKGSFLKHTRSKEHKEGVIQ